MREKVASALMSLGYQIDSHWTFSLRSERTPSCKINKDGRVHDFGSGFHGDLIDILKEYHHKNFKEAKEIAAKLLGEEVKIDFTTFEKSEGEVDERPLPENFMVPYRIDAEHHKQAYLGELKRLFMSKYQSRESLSAQWSEILKVAEKSSIGFNNKSGRLIMPIRDIDGKIRTFWKYKKKGEDFMMPDGRIRKHRKVLYTKNRFRPPFNVLDLFEFAKAPEIPVVVTEGEKDALVATANGLRAVCIGGAGASKKISDKYLQLFKGLKVIIAGDYDEAGKIFNQNIKEQMEPIATHVTILDWEQKAAKDGFKLHDKFDLADYFAFKNL